MSVEMRAEGKGEKYAFSIPAYACKEDLKQAVEDGMVIRNRNFVQSAELVCLQLLCTSLISLLNYSFKAIQNMTYQHQEFQTRLKDAERLRLYAQLVISNHKALSSSLASGVKLPALRE